jgi:hypothetical protein
MKPTPIISDQDLTLLREVRHYAAEVSECAALLYWETQYPDTVRTRFDSALRSLSALLVTAQLSFPPAKRTRFSWDGQTTTAHEETF